MTNSSRNRGNIAVKASVTLIVGLVASAATTGMAQAAPPGNDSFATPTDLTGALGVLRGTTVEASKEVGEPDHAGVLGNKSVWYRWTAPSTGRVAFRTLLWGERGFDSLLAVYRGDAVDALSVVASNDDSPYYGWESRVAFQAEAGTTYLVVVDAVAGKSGEFRLGWGMRPPNDHFAAAQPVAGPLGSTRSDTSLATREADEARWQRRSVWYRWTAPRSGDVVLRTSGSLFDTVLGVYVGRELDSLRLLARNDDIGYSVTSRVRLQVHEGRTYRIAVAGYFGDSGPVVLRWQMP